MNSNNITQLDSVSKLNVFEYLTQMSDIKNYKFINKSFRDLDAKTKYIRNVEYPHPDYFQFVELIESRYKTLYPLNTVFKNKNTKFIIRIEDEEDYDLIKKSKTDYVIKRLLNQTVELKLLYSEDVKLDHFLGYNFERLTIDFSIFSMNNKKNCTAQDLVKLFKPCMKKVILNNCDLDDTFFPTVLDVIHNCTKDCEVQLNVSKYCNYLFGLDKIREIHPKIHVMANYQVFSNYSKRTTKALFNEDFIFHPQIFSQPLEIPADIKYSSEVEEILKKYVISKVKLNRCVTASLIPEAEIESLKIYQKVPFALYESRALRNSLCEVEISEITPEHRMKEEYDFSDFNQLTCVKVVDDFPEKQKKKRIMKLPTTLKRFECETNFCDFGKNIIVEGKAGIAGLTNLTFLSFKEFGGSFDKVTFPISLKELEFHRATKLNNISQFEQLTNITKLIITDTEKVKKLYFPPHLKMLSFTHNPHIQDVDVTNLTQLTQLELTRYGGKSMKLPKQLKQFEMSDCQEIETINLKDTKVEEVSINTCNFVTEIKFPETLKSMRINDMEALESIHLSECLDCKVVELDCLEALKNLTLPTKLERIVIGDVAELKSFPDLGQFEHLNELQLVTVPCISVLNCPKNLTSLVLDDMEELILVNGFVKTQCRLEMGTCPKLNKKLLFD